MLRIMAQARKELIQTFRDKLTLALALLLPLILVALYGKSISFSVTGVPVMIQDFDQTARSRQYVEILMESQTFRLANTGLYTKPETALASEAARAIVTIPTNFERNLARGLNTEVQWLIDGTDANTATILRGDAAAITQAFLSQNGIRTTTMSPSVQVETRIWFNPGRETDKYIGPGAMAVVLALFPPLLAALAMSRENEQKTILQVYVSSISAHEYLLGKTIAFFLVGMAEWVLVVLFGMLLFGLRFAGDPTPFLVGTVVYLFCNVAFGVMTGARIKDQAATIQTIATVCFLLSFLLSGFIFPVSNIPDAIRWVAYFVPARYFIEIARDAFVRGGGWSAVWTAHVALTLLGVMYLVIAWRKMRQMQLAD
ncbi:MAG TPA: ABC transporter permease [Acidobacteriota bacterium]|nr:ABC transporter permease [Acidobacteriota bacterium]HNB71912.1 ABC transporter permease [Acidobacteriota bacterium]